MPPNRASRGWWVQRGKDLLEGVKVLVDLQPEVLLHTVHRVQRFCIPLRGPKWGVREGVDVGVGVKFRVWTASGKQHRVPLSAAMPRLAASYLPIGPIT